MLVEVLIDMQSLQRTKQSCLDAAATAEVTWEKLVRRDQISSTWTEDVNQR